MAAARGTLDVGQGLRFFWQDPAWGSKLLVLTAFGLLTCTVLGLPFVAGYYYRTLQNSAEGDERPLPAWTDLGGLFLDGVRSLAFHAAHLALFFGPSLLLGFGITLAAGGAAALDLDRFDSSFDHNAGLALAVLIFYAMTALMALVLVAYLPAARARFVVTGRFADGFDVAANLRYIRRNIANYLFAYLLFVVANMLSNLGYLLCCVGVLPAAMWAGAVLAWGEGQVVRLDPDFE